uniref:Branchpoint-bridging protein n=2 Tax=Timema TaxID=61471 RepID=A0A7R9H0V8_TIMPO|nr:unnamed protein product [Timema poppensis]
MNSGESIFGSGSSRNFTSLLNPTYLQSTNGKESSKREADEREERRQKRRRSRWGGDEKEKTFIPGMPTVLPNNMSKEQERAYLVQLQIEEISRKLRTGELGIPLNPEDRSPSPEPIYSSDGKRLNTREYRTRKHLEEDRHHLIQEMLRLNPDFKPPADYKPPIIRVSDKVMIPQDDHPDINFVGLLIGPRGNTLKSMERETGAKIIIRGKGSVKEGKVGRKDGQPLPGEDEPLHAYVTANNPEAVKKAVDRIKEIIRQGVEVPEGQNDLRRMQLRELALLNGTLRENEGPRCTNCGASDHKSWMCPDKPNVTNNIVCSSCGGAGHIARDCRQKRPGSSGSAGGGDKNKIDEEYMSLMAELGEGPPPPRDDHHYQPRMNRAAPSNQFDRPGSSAPPRAIMAPLPPQMVPNTLPPPPWAPPALKQPGTVMLDTLQQSQQQQQQQQPQNMPPLNQPPPPWQSQQNLPPPAHMQARPPPPPPRAMIPPLLPWLQSQQPPPPGSQSVPPWQQQQQHTSPLNSAPPPGPVPPPHANTFPWHQGFPPPQPVQPPPPPGSDGGNHLSRLPSLLAAPPPPPPS